MTRHVASASAKHDTATFPPETLSFLRALKDNNNREWFGQNKDRYESAFVAPVAEFKAHIARSLESLTGKRHEAKVFRIHRDVRFSKDKTPYNAHIHIAFLPDVSSIARPAWMFGLDTERISVGAGVFAFEEKALKAFRDAVAGPDGQGLQRLLSRLERAGARISEPELKKVPPGFDAEAPQAALLRHKGLAAWMTNADPKAATKPEFAKKPQGGLQAPQAADGLAAGALKCAPVRLRRLAAVHTLERL